MSRFDVRGATMFELLVAMFIFSIVSTLVVILTANANVVSVWGEKRNEALRANREINRKIGYVLRTATSRPEFTNEAPQNAILSATATVRNTDPTQPPYPAGHQEIVTFWASTQDARRLIQDPGFPVPEYPAPLAFDPRTSVMDVPNNYSRMNLVWSIDTGNFSLELRSNDGANLLASKQLTSYMPGRSPIRAVDFTRDQASRAVGMFLETRSRDANSKFAERRYGSTVYFQIPAWR
ncbi:MAG: hypothetical protein AMXMBFR33_49630 [Candidatus Xenobia bacterium]